jgi:polyisoprenoid-binding protein YceI
VKPLLCAALALLSAAPATLLAKDATDWQLDSSHSRIGFVVTHLGFARVRGQFTRYDAQVTADDATGKVSRVVATAEVASVNTGVARRDADLRSDNFFSAAKFPELKLETKTITWDGKKVTAVVALTLRDVTRDVTLTGEQLGAGKVDLGYGPQFRTGYTLGGKINRKDFGLTWSTVTEGLPIVGDEVTLELEVQIWRSAGAS